MKIALCFSGQPRHITNSYNFIKNNFIDPNKIEDIFVHTWWRDEWVEKEFQNINRPNFKFNPEALNQIKNLYSPKKILIEDDRDYHDFINETFVNNTEYISEQKHNIINTYPKYFSMYQSNKLKNDYEKEMGFEYDAIARMRLDFCPKINIKVKNYNLDEVNLGTVGRENYLGKVTHGNVNDLFAISNKKNMDFYCEVANNLLDIAKRRPGTSAEGTLGFHLLDGGIQSRFCWLDRNQIDIFRHIGK